jgi:Uma2 family endonuclease
MTAMTTMTTAGPFGPTQSAPPPPPPRPEPAVQSAAAAAEVPFPASAPGSVPPLLEGDRLTQAEFMRRYEATGPVVRAQLINGVVYMASPVLLDHSEPQSQLGGILSRYEEATPGVRYNIAPTSILGGSSQPEPDLLLRILPEFGGRSARSEKGYLVGPPELVIEVSNTSVYVDLGPKLDDYRRAGVREYAVVVVPQGRVRFFDLADDRETAPDADGLWRSRAFPGLWIDAAAAIAADQSRLLAALRAGLASEGHAEFVRSLEARRSAPRPQG